VEQHALDMKLLSQIKLSDQEKLEILQRLDQFRVWHSLDEKRYCLVCGKNITGREIEVTGGTLGPLRVNCPTEHCNSIPMNWVRPQEEVLIKISKLGGNRCEVAGPLVQRPARKNSGEKSKARLEARIF
jgi:hypothetical protein